MAPVSEARIGLIGAFLVAIGPVSMSVYTPAMPAIVAWFSTSEAVVKASLSLYFAGFAVAQLFCGPLSDALGRRSVTLGFLALYVAGSLAGVFAQSVEGLVAARFIQGTGAAVGVVMARALVRDLFTEETGARIMNLVGIILAVAPAAAPTLGGLVLTMAGWPAIFWLMVAYGAGLTAAVWAVMPETVTPDPARLRPGAILATYATLLTTPSFLAAALTLAGTIGALYAQATILPFLLMDRIGLSPAGFGLAMLAQSGSYFLGSLAARPLMERHGALALVAPGLALVAVASLALAVGLRLLAPGLGLVMGPVAAFTVGIAWITPAMTTQALRPFAAMAGAASALMGFLQMGLGLAGGMLSALIGDAAVAMATIIPAYGLMAIIAYGQWRRRAVSAGGGPRASADAGRSDG